jgi:hypothetical protein
MHSQSNTIEQHGRSSPEIGARMLLRNKPLSIAIEKRPQRLERPDYPLHGEWDGYSFTFGSMERSPEEHGVICWLGKRVSKRQVKRAAHTAPQHKIKSPGSGMKARHCRIATPPLQMASPIMPRGNALSKQHQRAP